MINVLDSFIANLIRKKRYGESEIVNTSLKRCLNVIDLTAIGIGCTLGAGIYIIAGEVARKVGPALFLSFFIAALAALLAGLCYAEFGSRVPRTGSAYIYSYVAVGEIMAFIIGWNLILEYVIGTASSARAWSINFDVAIGNRMSIFFNRTMYMNQYGLAEYVDVFAFAITFVLTILLSIGVKESSLFNNILTGLNITVIVFVVIMGLFYVDVSNWQIPPVNKNDINLTEYKTAIGNGYFMPFGISGVIEGAGTCFYAFVGFDSISTSSEEVINPQKNIPAAIIVCLSVCVLAYASVSIVITLMCPYYLLDPKAPLTFVFQRLHLYIPKYIVNIGAIFGLSTSLLCGMLPLPRIIYAMSCDGLIFKFLNAIHPRFKTPLIATMISGIFAGLMAALFDLKSLVDMMSIGTLLAYTLVAFSVILLRGIEDPVDKLSSPDHEEKKGIEYSVDKLSSPDHEEKINLLDNAVTRLTIKQYFRYSLVSHNHFPTKITSLITQINAGILFFLMFPFNILLLTVTYKSTLVIQLYYLLLALVIVLAIIIVLLCFTLSRQPENIHQGKFKVPLVPWLPTVSMLINIHLMMKLPVATWYRFAVWMIIGFLIYFLYGIRNSKQRVKEMTKWL